MNQTERDLLYLVESVIKNNECVIPKNMDELFVCAERQKILPFLFECLSGRINKELQQELNRVTYKNIAQFWHLFTLTRQITKALLDHEIPVAVLKGISTANYYPVMEYRKSGDIDLLIRNSDSKKAEKILNEHCFTRNEKQDAIHHISYTGNSGIEIEMHILFVEPFDNTKANHLLKYYSEEALSHVHLIRIEGVSFPILDETFQALSIILHMLQDYLRAGFGLKLLIDWSLFWNNWENPAEKDAFFQIASEFGIMGFVDTVTSTCSEIGFLEQSYNPIASLEPDIHKMLLQDIFEAGEFGKGDNTRMVALRGHGLGAYFREFHHQMCLNHPNSSHILLLWPVLWVETLAGFIKNNNKIRKIKTFDIILKASKRMVLTNKMKLFRK